MENPGILPRITVPDEGDRATVAIALTRYWHHVAHTAMNGPDLVTAVEEGHVIISLIQGLINETNAELDALAASAADDMEAGIQSLLDGENPSDL